MSIPWVLLLVCGSCCLFPILASCALTILGWIVRTIRPRRKKAFDTPASSDAGEVIEGEYKEIEPDRGKG